MPESVLVDVAEKLALSGKVKTAGKINTTYKPNFVGKLLEGNNFGRKVLFGQALKTVLSKTKGNYPAPLKIIECIRAGVEQSAAQGYQVEADLFGELVMTDVSASLRSIFFATTDMKKEQGIEGVDPAEVNNVAVLGGGLMGGGIAFVTTTKAGVPARIKDIAQEGIRHAFKYSYDLLNKKVKRRFMTKAQMQKQLSLLSAGTDFVGFKDSDIIVEAVFEDLNLKQQMVADIEANCKPTTVFASNTSSLPIHNIAANAERPENVIGLHYFSPVDKMPLVEVIATDKTSDKTISTTVEFARRQGKTPIVVKDEAGFFVNRILGLYMA